jgi:hypothetical protein
LQTRVDRQEFRASHETRYAVDTGAVTWFALTRCTCTSSAREVGIADDLRHVAVALAQDGDVAFALSGALSGLGVAAAGLPYLVIYRTGPP